MDADGKPQTNGKCHSNGTATNGTLSSGDVHTPTQTRTRSLDSDKVAHWEPSPEEKELIKLTWSDDFK
jgi:hypothetical protein